MKFDVQFFQKIEGDITYLLLYSFFYFNTMNVEHDQNITNAEGRSSLQIAECDRLLINLLTINS